MGKSDYKYDYSDYYLRIWIQIRILSHTHTKKIVDMKARKVCKLMHIYAIIYKLWCLLYNNKKYKMLWLNLIFVCPIKYNVIRVDKKGRIGIQIYSVWRKKGGIWIQIYLGCQKSANTNISTGICKYEYKYKYLSHTAVLPDGPEAFPQLVILFQSRRGVWDVWNPKKQEIKTQRGLQTLPREQPS